MRKEIKVAILTISDKSSAGKRKDKSGPIINSRVKNIKAKVLCREIIPDNKKTIEKKLKILADELKIDLILTTGGTGFSARDVTPEATRAVIEKEIPGIPEAMRIKSLKFTLKAMLSRSIAGIRGKTLIINLPGSSVAVKECLDIILPVIPHAVELLQGKGGECGRR
ncbi:molybdenum cofactor biosynthesis protein [Candidatus Desantisbacteria bacterium CG1_02_38_46]|uniref:Molybdenum cofactor biosynthesis protein B n=3 Tax=unclassified Candidatus Desantisiibacteriota TaxID=3106372 RepID=A0A2H9PAU6_9BACT|nr:MAG: molybdenum cofactor biosynthesis protein [Candidatus Desantisbacteria bacterium CG1_02_38_46]PIU52276.1 MAG: molybdenum cofactor biosynthesis protein [Candidatus Desantisbacteria bacterium CG07_land_8_20_14_0_80_39_15]PIZ15671.1 MAG: molybdenum cofactor biosynthesis protein [Candidatus Desantisbacteria bacterium CG_4_10_14_0_8_um_filter_39_17]